MQKIIHKVLQLGNPHNHRVQVGYLLLLSALFLFVSERCFWADSESWALKISGLTGEARANFDYFIKPGFHIFLSPIYHLSQTLGAHHMTLARWVFAFNGLIVLGLASFVLYGQTRSKSARWFFLALALSSWLYLEQGFRVRSDLLAMTVFLIHLILAFKIFDEGRVSVVNAGLFYLLAFLALSITPKISLLYLAFLPLGVALVRRLKANGKVESLQKIGFALLTLFTIWTLYDSRFSIAVVRQIKNFRQSIFESDGSVGVFAFYRFEHLIRFAVENPIIVLLGFIKIFWICKNRTRWIQHERGFFLDLGALLMLLGLFIFPDRMPWLIASYLPLVLIFSLNYPSSVWSELEIKLQRYRHFVGLGFGLILALAFFKTVRIHQSHNNDEQKLLAQSIDEYQKTYPEVRVYDPSGITRHSENYHFYLGPGDIQVNYWSAHLIKQAQPHVILVGQRFEWVKKLFGPEFLDAYWDPYQAGVYLRGRGYELPNESKASAIKGYKRVEVGDLILAVVDQAPNMELMHFRLSHWPHAALGSIFLEFEGGRLHPVTESGVPSDLYVQTIAIHVPKDTSKLYLFRAPSFAFFQLSMPRLLRFDSEF